MVRRYYYKNAKFIVKVYRVSETMSSELRPTHVTVETLHPLRHRLPKSKRPTFDVKFERSKTDVLADFFLGICGI